MKVLNGHGRSSPHEEVKRLRQEAAKRCHAEIEASLKKHGCIMIGIPALVPDGAGGWKIVTRVDVAISST
jgi:hypothetical protein